MDNIAFIITVYKNDKLEYFQEAIASIVNQDYGFENINIYLAIDGLLTSDIQEYIDNNKDIFYKIVINKINRGLAFTLNRLIKTLEDEKYIFRMDSDDICFLDRVSKQVQLFKKDPNLMLIGSDLIEIDEEGNQLRYKRMPKVKKDIIIYSISRNPFNHPTVVMRKEFFEVVGKYDENLLKSQDYELWARALVKGIKVSNISEPLLYFRVTNDFMSKRNSFVNYVNEFKVSMRLLQYFKMYGEFPKVLAKLLIRILPSSIGKKIYIKLRD